MRSIALGLVVLLATSCSAAPSASPSASTPASGATSVEPAASSPADGHSTLPEPTAHGLIAFITGSPIGSRPRSIAVISPEGGEPVQILPDGVAALSGPSWAPDGRSLIFGRSHCLPGQATSECVPGASISLVEYDLTKGSDVIRDVVVSSEGEFAMWPDWSPDGSRIAFIRGTAGQQAPFELVVVDADGLHPAVLETNLAVMVGPDWSPDGGRITFSGRASWDGGGNQIYTIDADGGDLRQATPIDLGNAVLPAWSPDGDRLAFTLGDAIWWTPTALWDPRPFPVTGRRTDAVFSPDGTRLAFLGDGQQLGWIVIPLDRTYELDEQLLEAHGSELDWGVSSAT